MFTVSNQAKAVLLAADIHASTEYQWTARSEWPDTHYLKSHHITYIWRTYQLYPVTSVYIGYTSVHN